MRSPEETVVQSRSDALDHLLRLAHSGERPNYAMKLTSGLRKLASLASVRPRAAMPVAGRWIALAKDHMFYKIRSPNALVTNPTASSAVRL